MSLERRTQIEGALRQAVQWARYRATGQRPTAIAVDVLMACDFYLDTYGAVSLALALDCFSAIGGVCPGEDLSVETIDRTIEVLARARRSQIAVGGDDG